MTGVTRLETNPLVETNSSVGDNINHPSVISVPDWVEDPLGEYYLYFSHKRGSYIRLAYADDIEGPWQIHTDGTLQLQETQFVGHIASPDVHIDHSQKCIRMYYHGETRALDLLRNPWRNERYRTERYGFRKRHIPYRVLFNTGREIYNRARRSTSNRKSTTTKKTGSEGTDSGETARKSSFEQQLWKYNLIPSPIQETRQAVSHNGLDFTSTSTILGPSWFRMFEYRDQYYALARDGYVYSSRSPDSPFTRERKLFDTHRHFGVDVSGDALFVYYSRPTDFPERIVLTEVALNSDVDDWSKQGTQEVIGPELPYEGADVDLDDSNQRGPADRRRELRDPYVFETNKTKYLFYAVAGESGIGVSKISQ